MKSKVLILILGFSCQLNAGVQSLIAESNFKKKEQTSEATSQDGNAYAQRYYTRFSQHEDNLLLADYFRGNKTDGHLDITTSFRYLLNEPDGDNPGGGDWAAFLAYTGEFDFFVNSRPSGPVVGTKNNIGLFYASYDPKRMFGLMEWRLSLEHESNGQATNDLAQLDAQKRQFRNKWRNDKANLPSDAEIDRMAYETISRANNFVSAGGVYRVSSNYNESYDSCDLSIRCFDLYFKFRHQLAYGLEDEIWWASPVGKAELKDFIGIQLDLDSTFYLNNVRQSVTLTYRTGQLLGGSPGKNNTFDLKYFVDIPMGNLLGLSNRKISLPFVVSCHTGYLEELYRYSEKSSYCLFGLHARY